MKISVRTGGLLDQYLPPGSDGGSAEIEVAEGATPMDVLRQLGLPVDDNYLISLNGEVVIRSERERRVLAPQDSLAIMPPLKGG